MKLRKSKKLSIKKISLERINNLINFLIKGKKNIWQDYQF